MSYRQFQLKTDASFLHASQWYAPTLKGVRFPAQSTTLGFHLLNLTRRFWQLPGGAVMSGHLHTWRTTSCPPAFYTQKLAVLQVGAFSRDQPQHEAAFTFPLASTASAALLASDPGPNPYLLFGLEPCRWGLQGWSLRLVFRTIAAFRALLYVWFSTYRSTLSMNSIINSFFLWLCGDY